MQIKRNLYHCIKTLIKNVFLLNFTYEFLISFSIQCRNPMFKEIRFSFIQKIHQINSSFSLFSNHDLFFLHHINEPSYHDIGFKA